MNSTKLKKKSKSAKIPKPIKIKKEDDHILYPMEHYVDDRVELIRQIFASLKPKTITNLAPEFLKKNKLEEIQEQCLNEILGISKKRLLAVINSTKCPTDTETSSDDDVNSQAEHISLEEISSDSDIAEQKGSKACKFEGTKKQKVKRETDTENNKQFSVLELLELQARARAIRSQLALEPVTKIEVDTDSDEEGAPSKKTEPVSSHKKVNKTTNGGRTTSKSDSTKRSANGPKPNGEPASSAPSKRIKLKRYFRKQTHDDNSNDEANTTETTPKVSQPRSPSPDVIPIIAVPETLCISDSDDDNTVVNETSNDSATPTPDDINKPVEILSVVSISATESDTTSSLETNSKPDELPNNSVPVEPEEGEIFDEENTSTLEPPSANSSTPEVIATEQIDRNTPDDLVETSNKKEQTANTNISEDKEYPKATENKPQTTGNSESEDDANDDIISLEGGDLLNEMKAHLKDDPEELKDTTPAEEVICLDDSSDEDTKNKKNTESWNERWLKSSKVSKVLAASRLGNRLRNKIKESKKAKKLEQAAITQSEQTKSQEVIFTSKHEDGSVEQYKEIMDSIQRKTD